MTAWSQSFLPALSDDQFDNWLKLVEERTGIDFSQHRSILQSGLSRRLRELDRSDFDAYYDEVVQVPQGLGEWQLLLATLTVKETSFFRQPAAYDLVRGYRSEEHTSELQSRENLVCRLLLEKKKRKK